MKKIAIFDLDETVISSKHRYRNKPCGSIDLAYWIANATPENIAKDKLLPFASEYHKAIACPFTVVIVATARQCSNSDYLYVAKHLGAPDHFISRRPNDSRPDWLLKVLGLRRLFTAQGWHDMMAVFYDDNLLNIKAVAKALPNVQAVHVKV